MVKQKSTRVLDPAPGANQDDKEKLEAQQTSIQNPPQAADK